MNEMESLGQTLVDAAEKMDPDSAYGKHNSTTTTTTTMIHTFLSSAWAHFRSRVSQLHRDVVDLLAIRAALTNF